MPNFCIKCDCETDSPENDYGEFICDDCEQNAAEAAYERQCESFYGGGHCSLAQQQADARRFK